MSDGDPKALGGDRLEKGSANTGLRLRALVRNLASSHIAVAVLLLLALTAVSTFIAYRKLDGYARNAAFSAGRSRATAARSQSLTEREQLARRPPAGPAVTSLVAPDGQLLSGPRVTPVSPVSDYEPFRRTPYRVEFENGDTTEAYGGYIGLTGGRHVFVGERLDAYSAQEAPVLSAILASGLFASAVMVVYGARRRRRIDRRLDEVMDVLDRISRGDFSRQLTGDENGDEWERLRAHVNVVSIRLGSMIGQLGTLADLVSHELGSAVGRVQRRIERISKAPDLDQAQETAREALAETLRVRDTVQALLELNSIRTGGTRRFGRIDLAPVAREVIQMYAATAEDARLDLQSQLSKAEILGERDLIVQLLANLLDNAIKYTPAAGTVSVSIAAHQNTVSLTVDDSGPGIPAEARNTVFQPARRLTRDRGKEGFGYGLAVVHAIAKRHGGDVTLPDVARGLRVLVTFPRYNSATQREPRISPSTSR